MQNRSLRNNFQPGETALREQKRSIRTVLGGIALSFAMLGALCTWDDSHKFRQNRQNALSLQEGFQAAGTDARAAQANGFSSPGPLITVLFGSLFAGIMIHPVSKREEQKIRAPYMRDLQRLGLK